MEDVEGMVKKNYINKFWLFSLLSLIVLSALLANNQNAEAVVIKTITAAPSGTTTFSTLNTWNPVGGTSLAAVLAQESPDKYIKSTINNNHQTYIFPNNLVPNGVTINDLTLNVFAKKPGTQLTKISFTIAKGSTLNDSPSGGFDLTQAYPATPYKRVMTTDPFGGSWTQAKINGWASGTTPYSLGVAQNTNAKESDVGMVFLEIHVTDFTAPVISPIPNQTLEATGPAGAVATYSATATDNFDGTVPVSCTKSSGSTFALGTNSVTCNATDSSGNAALPVSFTITVRDTIPPTAPAPVADQTLEATSPAGAVATFATPTSTDTVDTSVNVSCTAASGNTFPYTAPSPTPTTVTCTATDDSNNTASSSFTITVRDTIPPVLNLPANIEGFPATGPGGAIVTYDASASDIVDGSVPITCDPPSSSTFVIGISPVNCTATDESLNTASGSFTVELVDVIPPTGSITFNQPDGTPWGDVTVTIICDDQGGSGCKDMILDPTGVAPADGTHSAIPLIGTTETIAYSDAGSHTAAVRLFDNAGNSAVFKDTISLVEHQTALTLKIAGVTSENQPMTASGQVIDLSNANNFVKDATVTLTDTGSLNLADPVTTGITINDANGAVVTAGSPKILSLHLNSIIEVPFLPSDVLFTFNGVSAGGTGTISFETIGFGLDGSEITRPGTTSLPDGNPVRGPTLGGGITSVKITGFPGDSVPGATIGISNIETKLLDDTVHDVDIDADQGSYTDPLTLDGGTYASSGKFGGAGIVQITAHYGGEVSRYLAPDDVSITVNVEGDTSGVDGRGGNVAVTNYDGKIFSPYNCGDAGTDNVAGSSVDTDGDTILDTTDPDDDGDYLCDYWEVTGIPFTFTNYASGASTATYYLPLSGSRTTKDIWVEQDYMTSGSSTHKLTSAAETMLVNKFATKGITLHIVDDDAIAEVAAFAVFTDTDATSGNDHQTFKQRWFGTSAEQTYTTGTASLSTSAAGSCTGTTTTNNAVTYSTFARDVTVTITGITVNTPSSSLTSGATSGTVLISFNLPATVTASSPGTNPPNGMEIVAGSTAPAVTGSGSGLSTGAMTYAGNVSWDVTASQLTKKITLRVPFSVTAAGSYSLGTVTIPFKVVGKDISTAYTNVTSCLEVSSTAATSIPGGIGAISSLLEAKSKAYHYLTNVHSIGTCPVPVGGGTPSGRSETLGNDMVQAMGCGWTVDGFGHSVGTDKEQAGTFMHELGHNLNLNHGGPEKLLVAETVGVPGAQTTFARDTVPADRSTNCKPNESSVMTYSGQVPGYIPVANWNLDYSVGGLPSLQESSLDESAVANVAGSPMIVYANQLVSGLFSNDTFNGGDIDWDRDGTTDSTNVPVNINDFNIYNCVDNAASPFQTTLYHSYNEWNHLNYNLRSLISGTYDAASVTSVDTTNTAPDLGSLVLQQIKIQTSVFKGVIPPPAEDGTEIRNAGSNLPLKFKLFEGDGTTLITFGEAYADITIKTGTNTVGTVGTIAPFTYDPVALHHSLGWHTPNVPGIYYITIYMKVPGSSSVVPLFDVDNPPLYDAAGNRVTNIVTLT